MKMEARKKASLFVHTCIPIALPGAFWMVSFILFFFSFCFALFFALCFFQTRPLSLGFCMMHQQLSGAGLGQSRWGQPSQPSCICLMCSDLESDFHNHAVVGKSKPKLENRSSMSSPVFLPDEGVPDYLTVMTSLCPWCYQQALLVKKALGWRHVFPQS